MPRLDPGTQRQVKDLLYSVVNRSAFRTLDHYGANKEIKADLHFSPGFGSWRTSEVDEAYLRLLKIMGYELPKRAHANKKRSKKQ